MATLTPRTSRKPAFSLIELLVVLAIVAMLIATLLPVLGRSRDAARDLSCQATLQQLNTAWQSVLINTRHRIPETYKATPPPGSPTQDPANQRWDVLLNDIMQTPELPDEKIGIVCPTARNIYASFRYAAGFTSYGVNVRWTPGSAAGDNERQSWDSLFSPATYPLFADTDAYPGFTPSIVYDKIGYQLPSAPSPDWQLGFFHDQQTTNLAWADGHVESQNRDLLNSPVDANHVPLFFFNRARADRLAAAW